MQTNFTNAEPEGANTEQPKQGTKSVILDLFSKVKHEYTAVKNAARIAAGDLEEEHTGSRKWSKEIFSNRTEKELLGSAAVTVVSAALQFSPATTGLILLGAVARGVYNRAKNPVAVPYTSRDLAKDLGTGAVAAVALAFAPGISMGQSIGATAAWLARARLDQKAKRKAAANPQL